MVDTITESVDVGVPVRAAYDQWTPFEAFLADSRGSSKTKGWRPEHGAAR
jgi:hypothetical protein